MKFEEMTVEQLRDLHKAAERMANQLGVVFESDWTYTRTQLSALAQLDIPLGDSVPGWSRWIMLCGALEGLWASLAGIDID
jgi:hypothetical protein